MSSQVADLPDRSYRLQGGQSCIQGVDTLLHRDYRALVTFEECDVHAEGLGASQGIGGAGFRKRGIAAESVLLFRPLQADPEKRWLTGTRVAANVLPGSAWLREEQWGVTRDQDGREPGQGCSKRDRPARAQGTANMKRVSAVWMPVFAALAETRGQDNSTDLVVLLIQESVGAFFFWSRFLSLLLRSGQTTKASSTSRRSAGTPRSGGVCLLIWVC